MNDPHVSALIYRVIHSEFVNYDKAEQLEYETSDFKVHVKDREARFEMKAHFATAEAAREVVEPLIRRWEFSAIFDRGPGEFELKFVNAVIEDRKPTPGVLYVDAGAYVLTGYAPTMIIGRGQYPDLPLGIAMNADVDVMALRYIRYREGKETLAGMAYFCLTVLEQAAGGRPQIPGTFGVASSVISTLGRLTGERGGAEARKGSGRSRDFTGGERNWIDQATKRIIRRAAEVAHDPTSASTQITMADFPKL